MNYSDFPDIQQDEWSLTRPTFPTLKGGTLTVVGWSGRQGTSKCYIVECSECKKDKYLNGEGVYKITKGVISKWVIPCGCSKKTHFSKSQYFEIIRRASEQKGYTMLGFLNDPQKKITATTKIRVSCQKHGEWSTTSVTKAVSQGVGCPGCRREKVAHRNSSRRRIDVPDDVLQSLPDQYEITAVDGADIQVRCKICEIDEYAKNNLCTGTFSTKSYRLRVRQLPCRCSTGTYTPDQLIFRAEACCRALGYKFMGWIKKPRAAGSFNYRCPVHGIQTGKLDTLERGSGCPLCAGHSQKQGYINTVYDNLTSVAIKFGISKDSRKRVSTQNKRNLFQMEPAVVFNFPSVKACKDAEKACKDSLVCGILSSRELKDGHTETTSLQNIERVMEIYKRFGGARVKLPN